MPVKKDMGGFRLNMLSQGSNGLRIPNYQNSGIDRLLPRPLSSTSSWVVDLGGTSWQVTDSEGNVTAPATVPGEIQTDLVAAGVLPQDPYYRYNDVEYRWVVWKNWFYSRSFNMTPLQLAEAEVRPPPHLPPHLPPSPAA